MLLKFLKMSLQYVTSFPADNCKKNNFYADGKQKLLEGLSCHKPNDF